MKRTFKYAIKRSTYRGRSGAVEAVLQLIKYIVVISKSKSLIGQNWAESIQPQKEE